LQLQLLLSLASWTPPPLLLPLLSPVLPPRVCVSVQRKGKSPINKQAARLSLLSCTQQQPQFSTWAVVYLNQLHYLKKAVNVFLRNAFVCEQFHAPQMLFDIVNHQLLRFGVVEMFEIVGRCCKTSSVLMPNDFGFFSFTRIECHVIDVF
jgi:hypothetical protein